MGFAVGFAVDYTACLQHAGILDHHRHTRMRWLSKLASSPPLLAVPTAQVVGTGQGLASAARGCRPACWRGPASALKVSYAFEGHGARTPAPRGALAARRR